MKNLTFIALLLVQVCSAKSENIREQTYPGAVNPPSNFSSLPPQNCNGHIACVFVPRPVNNIDTGERLTNYFVYTQNDATGEKSDFIDFAGYESVDLNGLTAYFQQAQKAGLCSYWRIGSRKNDK